MIKAVIFDLDGIIVESEQVWDRVRHRFVDAHGGAWREDSSRHMMGLSTRAWVRYLTADLGVALPEEDVAAQVIEEMNREYGQSLPLIAGATQVVRELSAHWPLAVASGSPMSLIQVVLEGASIRSEFEVLVSSDEVDNGKPAPDVYIEAARRLNVPAASCVIIEDSRNGIVSGVAAGGRVIAIPNRAYPLDPEALSLAALVFADITGVTPDAVRTLG